MKKHLNIFSLLLLWAAVSLVGCKDDSASLEAPDKVTYLNYRATRGGAILHYQLPADDNLLYVKAEYTNAQGEKVNKVSSYLCDSVEIDGFLDTNPQAVKLYSVGRNKRHSEPVEVSVEPMRSYIYDVNQSLTIEPRFGGFTIRWDNPSAKQVYVYIYYTPLEGELKDREQYHIVSSSAVRGVQRIVGLDAVAHKVRFLVQDFNNNSTPSQDLTNTVTPLFEQKLNKTLWKVLPGSANGDKFEGKLVSFWDDVIDTADDPSDNSYFIIHRENQPNGVMVFPLRIGLDMGKMVVINRFVVYQRAFLYRNAEQNGASPGEYYYYGEENIRSFALYCSPDNVTWTPLGTFDIGDPRDEDGKVPNWAIQEAIKGHEFELNEVSPPFRYFRFEITGNYGNINQCVGSELSLFGQETQP